MEAGASGFSDPLWVAAVGAGARSLNDDLALRGLTAQLIRPADSGVRRGFTLVSRTASSSGVTLTFTEDTGLLTFGTASASTVTFASVGLAYEALT